jgi:hypothetical protein
MVSMRNYVKPVFSCIQLRTEEGIACFGSKEVLPQKDDYKYGKGWGKHWGNPWGGKKKKGKS